MADTITNDEALAMIAKGHAALSANLAKVEPPKEEPKPVEPKPPAAGPVTTVKTLAALTTALKAAKAGEVIELAAGEYGAYSLKGVVAPGVTVRAAGAKVAGLVLTACEGITFEGLSADLAAGGAVKLDGCKSIGLIRLTSRNAKLYGVSILRSKDVRVIEADISDVKDGVQGANSRGVLVERCKVRRFRADGINMCGVSDLRVIKNDVSDCIAADDAHPDAVQLHTASADAPAENIEVVGNRFWRGSGRYFQGVFITDQTGVKPYRNVRVADNLIEGAMFNGIALSNADGFSITGNTVQPFSDMDSRIQIGGSRNGVVESNKAKVLQGAGNAALKLAGNTTPAAIAA